MRRPTRQWIVPLVVAALATVPLLLDDLTVQLAPGSGASGIGPAADQPMPTSRTSDDEEMPILTAAGDIASCAWDRDEATAALLDDIPGVVATLGDNVHPQGTLSLYEECYERSWGRHRHRTYPVPGNHDYDGGPEGYFAYFGQRAGRAGHGYYTYEVGAWRVYALNSNCELVPGGCAPGSPQHEWLATDLASRPADCILAYWHEPAFARGTGSAAREAVRPFVELLYRAGADVVLSGSVHNFQRSAPLDPEGAVDERFGIRHFVAGTGGVSLRELMKPPPTVEAWSDEVHGVLTLTLNPGAYAWEFLAVDGTSVDAGSDTCRGAP